METILLAVVIADFIISLVIAFVLLPQYAKRIDLEKQVQVLRAEILHLHELQSDQQKAHSERLCQLIEKYEQSNDKKWVTFEHRQQELIRQTQEELVQRLSNGLNQLENTIREPLL
jgi:type II secretory pathway pseudopilin PulG